MRALASSGDEPRAEASANSGRPRRVPTPPARWDAPNGLDRVGHKSMAAVGAESTSRPPADLDALAALVTLLSGAARQHPHLGPPLAHGRDQASSNTSLTDTAPGSVARTARGTTPVPLPYPGTIVRDRISTVTSRTRGLVTLPTCLTVGSAAMPVMMHCSQSPYPLVSKKTVALSHTGCRLRRTGVGAVRGESSL